MRGRQQGLGNVQFYMKKIVKQTREIIKQLSTIEERHLLEFLAVDSGFKDVMRIHISNNHEYYLLSEYCLKNNFSIAHSSFKLKLDYSNEIGDRFYKYTDWNDKSSEEYIAYISKNKIEVLSIARRIEVDGTHCDAGTLYGYPLCCSHNYNVIANGEDWINVLSNNSQGFLFSPLANKLAYIVHGFTLFPDYFPCSYNCEITAELGKKYYKIGVKYGLKNMVDTILGLMGEVYLVADKGIFSFPEWNIYKDILSISVNKRSVHGKNILLNYPKSTIELKLPRESSDSLFWEWEGNRFRIFIFSDDKKDS